jgi:hypothetical protein
MSLALIFGAGLVVNFDSWYACSLVAGRTMRGVVVWWKLRRH